MRLEDMKNDIPETPDFIHNMIQNEVAKQLADNKVANLRRRKRWTAPLFMTCRFNLHFFPAGKIDNDQYE